MPLDPQARAFLDQVAAANLPDVAALTPREARAQMELGAMMLGPKPAVGRAETFTIDGPDDAPLRLRLTAPAGPGPSAGLVFLHGGGWVAGSLASHDHLCRAITLGADAAVVAVDYRLAPEHPYPAALRDAEAATAWVAAHARELGIDPDRRAVGGDSAGGALAAAVARRARDRGGPRLAFQVLIYPALDADFDTPSYLEYAEGYLLTRAAMVWYWGHYLPDPSSLRGDPDACPMAADGLAGLPPALVITAGYDPLRDEGEAYARRLRADGVETGLTRYPGMVHGFLRRHATFDAAEAALAEVAAAVRGMPGSRSHPGAAPPAGSLR